MSDTYAVTLVTRHPMAKWVLPLGLLGLVPLGALMALLPKAQATTFFLVGRFVFVLAYGALLVLAFRTRRQNVSVLPSLAGLHDASTHAPIAASADIDDVLHVPKGAIQELQVRGRSALTLEVGTRDATLAILSALGRSSANATHRFLAKTTPTLYAVLTWMGLPIVGGIVAQGVLMSHAASARGADFDVWEFAPYAPILAVFLFAWAFGTYWFAKRRELVLSPTTFTYPRLLGGHVEYAYSEVESVRAIDTMTAVLVMRGERPRTLRIYNPDELAAFLEHLRARVSSSAYPADARPPPDAALVATAKVKRGVGIGFLCGGLFLTVVLGMVAVKQLTTMARSVHAVGTVVDSMQSRTKGGGLVYRAVVAYGTPSGEIFRVSSISTESSPFVVGSQMPVLYDPAEPRVGMVDDFASRWTLVLAWLLGPIMLAIGVFELRTSRKGLAQTTRR